MSVRTALAPADVDTAPAQSRGWRRHRTWFVVGAFVLVAVVLTAWRTGGIADTSAPLDPDGTGSQGTRALVRVLGQQGVQVDVVRSADALDAARVSGTTPIVVSSTEQLGRTTIERLLEKAGGAGLILLAPEPAVLDELDVDGASGTVDSSEPIAARCEHDLYDGLTIEVDSARAMPGVESCFDGALGLLAVEGGVPAVLFGATDALTNDQILRADNAAVALRMLGGTDRLIWYVPTRADLVGEDDVSLRSLLPKALLPSLWLVGLSVLGLMFWRGRRLGALSVEPLPVAVRAIETTRSRGRLYRRSGDRAHAARALRQASRRRAARRLRLGRHPEQDAVIAAVARHTGRSHDEVAALLHDQAPAPTNDQALVHLATALSALDREVRRHE